MDTGYGSLVYRFPTEAAVEAWLAAGLQRLEWFFNVPVEPMRAVTNIGDESQAYAIKFRGLDNHLFYVRVGREVAQVQLWGSPGTTLVPVLRDTATARADCLRVEDVCGPIPLPADLATPTASQHLQREVLHRR